MTYPTQATSHAARMLSKPGCTTRESAMIAARTRRRPNQHVSASLPTNTIRPCPCPVHEKRISALAPPPEKGEQKGEPVPIVDRRARRRCCRRRRRRRCQPHDRHAAPHRRAACSLARAAGLRPLRSPRPITVELRCRAAASAGRTSPPEEHRHRRSVAGRPSRRARRRARPFERRADRPCSAARRAAQAARAAD